MFLTRSPLDLPVDCSTLDLVRLACVRHAASVRPEPGSNSPSRTRPPFPRRTRRCGAGPRRNCVQCAEIGVLPGCPSRAPLILPTGSASDRISISIDGRTYDVLRRRATVPHWRSVFSSVFKEHSYGHSSPRHGRCAMMPHLNGCRPLWGRTEQSSGPAWAAATPRPGGAHPDRGRRDRP